MNLLLETTTGKLTPAGTAPNLPRGGLERTFLQFLTNGVAALLPGGSPIALRLYQPNDLVNPVATLNAWTTSAPSLGYIGNFDTMQGGLSSLANATLVGKISYGAVNVDSQTFLVKYGIGASNAGVIVQIVEPQPIGVTLLSKTDTASPCLLKTGAGTLALKAGTAAAVAGVLVSFVAQQDVTMPALVAGTDYAVYVTSDGHCIADANFSAPAGYTTANSLKIGGFHYASGGNAAAHAGGDAVAAINPFSIWDLKWKPACLDPRGMALIAGGFWSDIYLLNNNPDVNGTSKSGVTICDGSSPSKIPAAFGGDGTAAYGSLTWFEACELLAAFGKRLPTQAEFAALAYGVTEGTSVGADPGTTQLDAPRTSRFGVMQAAGVMWVWGKDSAVDPTAAGPYGWQADTGGRGQSYIPGASSLKRVLLGAGWDYGAGAGSRASHWFIAPSDSADNIGARGVCDHLVLP